MASRREGRDESRREGGRGRERARARARSEKNEMERDEKQKERGGKRENPVPVNVFWAGDWQSFYDSSMSDRLPNPIR